MPARYLWGLKVMRLNPAALRAAAILLAASTATSSATYIFKDAANNNLDDITS